jgi:hypothetical protein
MAFRLTVWGGSDVRLQEASNFVITIMGGTDILMPTLAEKILYLKRARAEWGSMADIPQRRTTFITLMGGTEMKWPTMAQEIEDMVKLRQSGALPEAELAQLWREVIRRGDTDSIETFTLMGWTGEGKPSIKDELKDLKRIAARGFLSPQEVHELEALIKGDYFPEMRTPLLQQRLHALLATPQGAKTYRTDPLETARIEDQRSRAEEGG